MLISCDSTDPDDNLVKEINPKLNRIFYWGFEDPSNKTPNFEESVGPDILYVNWVTSDKIYGYTGELKNDVTKFGIIEIAVDPVSFEYKNYQLYEFSRLIYSIKYDSYQGKFLIVYSEGGGKIASSAALSGNSVVIENIIVNEKWNVEGIYPGSVPGNYIFTGKNPSDGKEGFFSISTNSNYDYKLLMEVQLDQFTASDFAVTKNNLIYYGVNFWGSSNSNMTRLMEIDLNENDTVPKVLAERNGAFLSLSVNPIDEELVLFNYGFGGDSEHPPQTHIELIDLSDVTSVDLDVRTHEFNSRFIVNEGPSWNPTGNHFAFSAGAIDGEGGKYPLELWIYENVP